MARARVTVREAVADDLEQLMELWQAHTDPVSEGDARAALQRATTSSDERVLVAERSGMVVGAVYLRTLLFSALRSDAALVVSHLQVHDEHRRVGAASQLLESALDWADERGLSQMFAQASSSSRDANRFLARLGLAQVATMRSGLTAVVRSRVGRPELSVRPGRRGTVDVVAHRRSMRRRLATSEDAAS